MHHHSAPAGVLHHGAAQMPGGCLEGLMFITMMHLIGIKWDEKKQKQLVMRCLKISFQLLEKDFFSATFFILVSMTVCEPSSIGFNVADLEVMTRLPEVCVPLLKALAATPYRTDLENAIRKKITAQRSDTTTTTTNTTNTTNNNNNT